MWSAAWSCSNLLSDEDLDLKIWGHFLLQPAAGSPASHFFLMKIRRSCRVDDQTHTCLLGAVAADHELLVDFGNLCEVHAGRSNGRLLRRWRQREVRISHGVHHHHALMGSHRIQDAVAIQQRALTRSGSCQVGHGLLHQSAYSTQCALRRGTRRENVECNIFPSNRSIYSTSILDQLHVESITMNLHLQSDDLQAIILVWHDVGWSWIDPAGPPAASLGGRRKLGPRLLDEARRHDNASDCVPDQRKQPRFRSCCWDSCSHGSRVHRLQRCGCLLLRYSSQPRPWGTNNRAPSKRKIMQTQFLLLHACFSTVLSWIFFMQREIIQGPGACFIFMQNTETLAETLCSWDFFFPLELWTRKV